MKFVWADVLLGYPSVCHVSDVDGLSSLVSFVQIFGGSLRRVSFHGLVAGVFYHRMRLRRTAVGHHYDLPWGTASGFWRFCQAWPIDTDGKKALKETPQGYGFSIPDGSQEGY